MNFFELWNIVSEVSSFPLAPDFSFESENKETENEKVERLIRQVGYFIDKEDERPTRVNPLYNDRITWLINSYAGKLVKRWNAPGITRKRPQEIQKLIKFFRERAENMRQNRAKYFVDTRTQPRRTA